MENKYIGECGLSGGLSSSTEGHLMNNLIKVSTGDVTPTTRSQIQEVDWTPDETPPPISYITSSNLTCVMNNFS